MYASRILKAIGVGRAEPFPPRRPHQRYLLGDHVVLVPWMSRFRFGWVVSLAGPYWHTAIGVVGDDWDDGNWLGGMSWRRHGPVAVCRYRRRGSWRSDRHFRRVMARQTPGC